MIINKQWLDKNKACKKSYAWIEKQDNLNDEVIAKQLYKEKKYDWCFFLLYRTTTKAKIYTWYMLILSFVLSAISVYLSYIGYEKEAVFISFALAFAVAAFAAVAIAAAAFAVAAAVDVVAIALAFAAAAIAAVVAIALAFAVATFGTAAVAFVAVAITAATAAAFAANNIFIKIACEFAMKRRRK